MKLTREQAIVEHRKMYIEMAEEIERTEKLINVLDFKMEYCKKNGFADICNYCFMCEYSVGECDECIIDWGSSAFIKCLDKKKNYDDKGYYSQLLDAETWQEQAALARQIAELPEREDV